MQSMTVGGGIQAETECSEVLACSTVSKVRVSVNIALGLCFMFRVSDYIRVLYHTNIALDTHITCC